MPRDSRPEPQFDELLIYQIALGAIGVASLGAGHVATALASVVLIVALALVASLSD